MEDMNGEYHDDLFIKEFLLEPSKPSRNMYSNNLLHQQSQQQQQLQQQQQQQRQQQQMQPGMMYGSNPGMCGVPNSSTYSNSNCYESNGALDPLSMHNSSSVSAPLVSPHYLPNLASHLPGLQLPSSSLSGSSSRMTMPNNNLTLSGNSMGIQSQGSIGMGLSGNSIGSNRIPYNSTSNQYGGPSSSVMGMLPNASMHNAGSSSIPMHVPSASSMGMHSNSTSGGIGLHSSSSGSSLGMHSVPSPVGMGMHSSSTTSGLGMHPAASLHSASSSSGMGMHSNPPPAMLPSASPSNRGMHSVASPSGMGMHSSASPSGMGMHSSASPSGMGMHSVASPGGMGMHSSASPSGMGMHSSVSPSGMGMRSNPSPAMHSSASPGGMGMHSSASPAGMGMHSSMPSPAPSLGKPSASPSRSALPVASPSVMNIQSATARSPMAPSASRSPYQSSPSHFSNPSPANIPSASPGRLSRPNASPGLMNMMTASPMSNHDMNGASYSASCSEGSSPAALERLAAERLPSGVTVSVTDRGEVSSQVRRSSPPQDVLTITPVQELYAEAGTSGTKKKKDITQVKKVRRKNSDDPGGKSKKRKAVRAQLLNSDPRGEPGFGAPSLYDLLTLQSPCVEGSLLSVGEIPSGSANYDITTAQGTVKRGRKRKTEGAPKASAKQRTTVTYQSQISSQNGIKLKIKKSEPVKKPVKQRVRKKKNKSSLDYDSDEGGHHRRVNHKSVAESCDEAREQSRWGTDALPKTILHKIFEYVSYDEGCLPFLVRMQRVCKHWREVAISPDLWHTIELCSTWVRDRAKNHHTFRWLCESRLTNVRDLNIGGWQFSGIPALLDVIANNCGELRGLNLSGWQGLLIEHILFLVSNCQKLKKLDLSGVNPEAHNNKGAVSLSSMQHLTSVMGERLTHLALGNNKLAGVPQIVCAIAGSCPNLEVLDMSNVRTVAHATAQIHIERLQEGCTKLRVLRIINSQFALAPVTIKEQVESPGFPNLEELSVASAIGRVNSLATSQPFIDDDAIGRILKTSNKLRLLDVRGCSKITDSSLVRIPAWDLEHLYLAGCYATRISGSGLELITQKWGHSLVELDLSWSSATEALDLAVSALAEVPEKGRASPLRILNLCGSSVSLEPVKAVLLNCLSLFSLNLASCRALPRGMKRHYEGIELVELRSQYEDKPRKPKVEEPPPEPVDAQHTEEVAGGSQGASGSGHASTENCVKSEAEPDSEPDLDLNDDSEDDRESDEHVSVPKLGLESDADQDSDHNQSYDHESPAKPRLENDFFGNESENERNSSYDIHDETNTRPEPSTPTYEEPDRLKTESPLHNSFTLQTQPSEAGPGMDDIEVMTPEDLQMVAEALANTPDADRIAAAAEAEAGMTPNGRSTPVASSCTSSSSGSGTSSSSSGASSSSSGASSTPRSGSGAYSEAGTPGPCPGTPGPSGTPGTLSEAGTESGTPGTPGTAAGTASGTTPQQGADGDGELLALAQDVKYSLDNHLNFSFSELDCGPSLQ